LLFNSVEFLVFLPIVLIVYQLSHRGQNAFLVFASCFFYASWDWRFVPAVALHEHRLLVRSPHGSLVRTRRHRLASHPPGSPRAASSL